MTIRKIKFKMSLEEAQALSAQLDKMRRLGWYAYRHMMNTTPMSAADEVNGRALQYIALEDRLRAALEKKIQPPAVAEG